jgi:hypothetical protein
VNGEVGAAGFEPTTSWSQTGLHQILFLASHYCKRAQYRANSRNPKRYNPCLPNVKSNANCRFAQNRAPVCNPFRQGAAKVFFRSSGVPSQTHRRAPRRGYAVNAVNAEWWLAQTSPPFAPCCVLDARFVKTAQFLSVARNAPTRARNANARANLATGHLISTLRHTFGTRLGRMPGVDPRSVQTLEQFTLECTRRIRTSRGRRTQ